MVWSSQHGRIRILWPNHHDRIREYFGRIIVAESEWYGRVNMSESENTFAESPWPNPNIMAESTSESEYFGRITMAESENTLAESHALVAAIRNLAYHRHHLVLGASDASAHAWLG